MVAANYVSHTPITINGVKAIPWFNPADFTLQPAGFPGNEGRNQLFSPAEKTFNFSIFKDFPIRESKTLQFRTEIFNLFDTPSFAPPNSTISSFSGGVGSTATAAGQFGLVTAPNAFYTPREIQFALKLLF